MPPRICGAVFLLSSTNHFCLSGDDLFYFILSAMIGAMFKLMKNIAALVSPSGAFGCAGRRGMGVFG